MMNGWMFFSPEVNSARQYQKFEVIFGTVPGMDFLSREEWHTYLPESRERMQGRTLGFFCGGGQGMNLSEMPDYPLRTFISDYVIMPSCWTNQVFLSVAAEPVEQYRIFHVPVNSPVITETGTFPDKPPYVRVYGSYCFFPPPYRLRTGGKEKG